MSGQDPMVPLLQRHAPASKSTNEEIIASLHALGLPQIWLDPTLEPEPKPVVGCAKCAWSGWVVPEWRTRDGEHGAVPCQYCRGPAIRQRSLDELFGQAEIPEEYRGVSFASYNLLPIHEQSYQEVEGEPAIVGTQADALAASLAYVARVQGGARESILLYSEQKGSGKTAMAVCIQTAIASQLECSHLFITEIDLLDRIRATYNDKSRATSDDVLNGVRDVDLLVLDDLGRAHRPRAKGRPIQESDATSWVTERLFAIVNWRQTNRLTTVYTSNKTLRQLEMSLDDATAWRIKDHCDPNIVRVQGKNLRDMPRAERAAAIARANAQ